MKRYPWTVLIRFVNSTILNEMKLKMILLKTRGSKYKRLTPVLNSWSSLNSGSITNAFNQICKQECSQALNWTKRSSFQLEFAIWHQIHMLVSLFTICIVNKSKDPLHQRWLMCLIQHSEWDKEHSICTFGETEKLICLSNAPLLVFSMNGLKSKSLM